MTISSRTGVTAGVTAGPPPDGRSWRRRSRIVAGLVATGLASTSLLTPGLAAAAVPTAPDNIVVFPNRDMVVLEGYESLIGKDVTVEVVRGTQLMGASTGKFPAGGAEFEINHPGGFCWGAAAGQPQVTPDIQAGDKVSVKADGAVISDMTVADAAVTAPASLAGNVLTVNGKIGAGLNTAFLEQRIINPDLVDTDVNRRDIRAVTGPDAAAPKGGYTSNLAVNGQDVVATYTFTTPATAELAAGSGGERMMAWQEQDADANRQGLTISEFGEPGGPGMGGCPAGPGSIGASTPGSAAAIRSTDKTSMQVNWTAATPAPGSAPVTGYSIVALGPTGSGDQVQIGRRTAANATQTTITGLDPAVATYTVEVRSITGASPDQAMSKAFTVAAPGQAGGGGGGTPDGDGTPPAVAISANAPVTFTNIQPGDQVYYTLDGNPAFDADMPSATALLYEAPIAITAANTVVNWVAFDAAGNKQDGTKTFGLATNQAPGAPTGVTVNPGAEFATVNWTAPTEVGASAITKYVITATPATGTPVVAEAGATLRTIQVRPLVGNTAYAVTVAAANAQGTGAASAPVNVTPTVNDVPRVSIGTSRWKAGDFRVTGTTSAPVGTLVRVYRGAPSATNTTPIATGNAVAGAVAGSQDYSIRARNNAAPAANPGQIYVTVTVNGVTGTAGPFATTNG